MPGPAWTVRALLRLARSRPGCAALRALLPACAAAAAAGSHSPPLSAPHPPAAGGWQTEKRRLRLLKEAEAPDDPTESFAYMGEARAGRTPLEALAEGQVVTGTVVAQHLYHGAQVGGWVGC